MSTNTTDVLQDKQIIVERLALAGITLTDSELDVYCGAPGVVVLAEGQEIPAGYKQCGHCKEIKKFILFNKNSASKNGCTGTCKDCQREAAKKSYDKTKKKRNYKEYYQANKEAKQEQSRKYYEQNKARLNQRHAEYHSSGRGKKVMQKAHAKRRAALAANAGIPYTRELVIRRDSDFRGTPQPICYLCDKPIEDISGQGLHLDHVISVNNGGKDCFTNVACTHKECNLRKEKDDRNLEAEQVKTIRARAEAFIEAHPDLFE